MTAQFGLHEMPTVIADPMDEHLDRSQHAQCSSCSMRELCVPFGLSPQEMAQLDGLVAVRQRVERGESLYALGSVFRNLYAVRTGFFKSVLQTEGGAEQVTGFYMAGELVGLDGIGRGRHEYDLVALEDSEVCVIPYTRLEEFARHIGGLQHNVHRIMSREIVRDQSMMMTLGSMRAEARLAGFFVNLLQRMSARGFSSTQIVLRMSREEMGSYLGLTIETISRTLKRLSDDGIISIKQRELQILAPERLRTVATQCKD
jgi:CRP/FNR family transcriptional regulator, anaerobic regulatory protein